MIRRTSLTLATVVLSTLLIAPGAIAGDFAKTIKQAAETEARLDYDEAATLWEEVGYDSSVPNAARMHALRALVRVEIVRERRANAEVAANALYDIDPAFTISDDTVPKVRHVFEIVKARRDQERARIPNQPSASIADTAPASVPDVETAPAAETHIGISPSHDDVAEQARQDRLRRRSEEAVVELEREKAEADAQRAAPRPTKNREPSKGSRSNSPGLQESLTATAIGAALGLGAGALSGLGAFGAMLVALGETSDEARYIGGGSVGMVACVGVSIVCVPVMGIGGCIGNSIFRANTPLDEAGEEKSLTALSQNPRSLPQHPLAAIAEPAPAQRY